MSDTTNIERDTKSGRFLAGNAGNGGRKPGARNKLGEQFLEDLRDCWQEHGVLALERCAREEPGQFVRVVASLMPKDLNLNIGISAESFAATFRTAQAMLGNPEPTPRRRLPGQRVIEHGD